MSGGSWEHPDIVAEREAQEAERRERRDITLGAYATEWAERHPNNRRTGRPLSPKSVHERTRMLRQAGTKGPNDPGGPLSELLDLKLGEVTTARVAAWHAAGIETGKRTQTSRAYELLEPIMKEALAEGLIDVNPCVVVGGKSQRTGIEIAPPRSDAEFEKLLEEMPDEYKALVVVFAAAACRCGEAVDLRADDITALRDGEGEIEYVAVTIDSQVQIIDGIVHQILPKAESVRSVILSGEDAEIIAERVEGRTGRERLFPARTDPSRPLSRSTFDRHYDRARKAAGMPNTRPHDLRHFAGTRYAQTGATLKEIMARLGHSSPSAALRYQHDADEARRIELATKAGRKRRMNKV